MLRKFPFPFRNMLAILSDADYCDQVKFENMHRFMNTLEDCGNLGTGVGLDIGDSFFMGLIKRQQMVLNPDPNWYYWDPATKKELSAAAMRKYLQAGWIDIPHTFFNYRNWRAYSREYARDVLKEWRRIGYLPFVWVDHWKCPWNIMFFNEKTLVKAGKAGDQEIYADATVGQNNKIFFPRSGASYTVLGQDQQETLVKIRLNSNLTVDIQQNEKFISYSQSETNCANSGAIPDSRFYCADLAVQAGIKTFWGPMSDSLRRSSLRGCLGLDTCLSPQVLPDGQSVWSFNRNYMPGQTNNTWLGKCIRRALYGDQYTSGKPLQPDKYLIISTHLGYGDADGEWDNNSYDLEPDIYKLNGGKWFNEETIQAFHALKEK